MVIAELSLSQKVENTAETYIRYFIKVTDQQYLVIRDL